MLVADHPLFWDSLQTLEDDHPSYLEKLLQENRLEQYLTSLVEQNLQARWDLKQGLPEASDQEVDELANEATTQMPTPHRPRRALSPQMKERLAEFKAKMRE
jgi:hypothetical protein